MTRMSPGEMPERLTFEDVLDKAFWSMLLGMAAYIASTAGAINSNIHSLNEKMAAIMEKVSSEDKRMDGFEYRLQRMEEKRSR